MLTELNYQTIVDLIGAFMGYALPIGILFGLSEKLVNLFFSIAFGSKTIKL